LRLRLLLMLREHLLNLLLVLLVKLHELLLVLLLQAQQLLGLVALRLRLLQLLLLLLLELHLLHLRLLLQMLEQLLLRGVRRLRLLGGERLLNGDRLLLGGDQLRLLRLHHLVPGLSHASACGRRGDREGVLRPRRRVARTAMVAAGEDKRRTCSASNQTLSAPMYRSCSRAWGPLPTTSAVVPRRRSQGGVQIAVL